MEKNANKSPPGKYSDDVLEGLFISPLEDSQSFERMEAEEEKILSPLRTPGAEIDQNAESASAPYTEEEKSAEAKSSVRITGLPQDQVVLRFAGELRSIKQDLLSIKQHFETMKRPQPSPLVPPIAPQDTAGEQIAVAVTAPAVSEDTKQLLDDIRKLLLYLDRLLESLPEEKIEEFANSEFFNLYRHVFEKLGLS